MTLTELSAVDRHRAIAAGFSEVAHGITDWSAPAPVDGWTARDVVTHLTEWFPAFLAGGGIDLAVSPAESQNPAAGSEDGETVESPADAWDRHAAAVQALLEGPAAAEPFTHPMIPAQPLANTIDSFYTADVFMHTWDLARAGNLTVELDPDFCARLLDGMTGMEDIMRGSGQYGPAVPVAADADPQTRMLGFIGRDPNWEDRSPVVG